MIITVCDVFINNIAVKKSLLTIVWRAVFDVFVYYLSKLLTLGGDQGRAGRSQFMQSLRPNITAATVAGATFAFFF